MDSREAQQHQHQHQHQQPPHPQQQQQSNMILGGYSNNAHPAMTMINPNIPPSGFPFNSVGPPRTQPSKQPSSDGGLFDGSSPPSSSGMRFSMDPAKKKRGRPRKYTPDGNIALGLSPTPISSSATSLPPHVADSGSGVGVGIGTPAVASDPPSKRNRGRPPGSGKKQLDALGVGGVGFTPHVITVKAGEDIASKIMAFSQQGPRTVCILSANGAICNVTLRQPAMSGGTVTYEGRYEIISLSGSFLLSENNGNRSRSGGLSVSLAGSDGRVLGGGVAGMLMAASPVQVIVGSFIADGKKSNSNIHKSGPSSAPTSQMLNFGAPMTTSSPPSQGVSSESSDENGSSPLNRDPPIYSNATQPLHNMNMYHQLWAAQNPH
ncbi:AT-hook motif nuclear-localized protein 13 isoform X2 [Ricinus communis]|uniref:AT-hook motif nuclear-localized protein 13 isoform X2 n=1 Tax=Ricinus communis TaxID=3988 RepID=UPI00201A63A2|nr:AT-hook motif nuclear-localized protein 13 isoform X2 [Ricinus communis]